MNDEERDSFLEKIIASSNENIKRLKVRINDTKLIKIPSDNLIQDDMITSFLNSSSQKHIIYSTQRNSYATNLLKTIKLREIGDDKSSAQNSFFDTRISEDVFVNYLADSSDEEISKIWNLLSYDSKFIYLYKTKKPFRIT